LLLFAIGATGPCAFVLFSAGGYIRPFGPPRPFRIYLVSLVFAGAASTAPY